MQKYLQSTKTSIYFVASIQESIAQVMLHLHTYRLQENFTKRPSFVKQDDRFGGFWPSGRYVNDDFYRKTD